MPPGGLWRYSPLSFTVTPWALSVLTCTSFACSASCTLSLWQTAFFPFAQGIKAPGTRDWHTALRVSHHLLLSHGLALRALRERCPEAQVGIALNLFPVYPHSDAAEDLEAASRVDGYHNRWFLDGRDPNSFTNVAWVFGLHDRP